MRRFGRCLGRVLLALVVIVGLLLAPVAYVELACKPAGAVADYAPILPADARRDEARTLLTYPEWHIVHAYDDYAQVIRTGDPQDFGFVQSVAGFWSSLCALSQQAGAHGGFPFETKQMVYTIGVSFSLEMAFKAAYEETLGRLAAMIRGDQRAPLDDLSATQAADYAAFLQQVPWYKWDFRRDADALAVADSGVFRDRERRLALGLEYRAKAAYAGVIAAAVAGVGEDALTLRSIVTGLTPEALAAIPDVTVIATRPEGVEIETPRYRAFTVLATDLARRGAEFVEIAGNDDILYTELADAPVPDALHSFARQGYGDYRMLRLVKVSALAGVLRSGARVEHVHDY